MRMELNNGNWNNTHVQCMWWQANCRYFSPFSIFLVYSLCVCDSRWMTVLRREKMARFVCWRAMFWWALVTNRADGAIVCAHRARTPCQLPTGKLWAPSAILSSVKRERAAFNSRHATNKSKSQHFCFVIFSLRSVSIGLEFRVSTDSLLVDKWVNRMRESIWRIFNCSSRFRWRNWN